MAWDLVVLLLVSVVQIGFVWAWVSLGFFGLVRVRDGFVVLGWAIGFDWLGNLGY